MTISTGQEEPVKQAGALSAAFKWGLLACFFLSGCCGLVYEIAWLRILALTFGNTAFATSTILSSYMAGLGFGALFFGRWIDRSSRHPIGVYAMLEGGVAAYALITPVLWKMIDWGNAAFYQAVNPSFLTFSFFKFAVCFAALFLPTFLMGGTLPVVARFFIRSRKDTARYVGLLYALNTFGAVAGVLFSGFYAVFNLGVWQTVYLAAFFNILIFIAFYRYVRKPAPVITEAVEPQPEKAGVPQAARPGFFTALLLLLFACSGGVSMVYEVAWTRVLATVLGSSVYGFSVMLATFLFGIALGSYLFSRWAARFPVDLLSFSLLQIATAISVLAGINAFNEMSYEFVKVYEWAKGDMVAIEFGKFLLCARVMLLPTVFIGALFTCFIHIYRHSRFLGTEVGSAYFSNTIGTIIGSALTGFFVIPAIGVEKTLITGAVINTAIGVITFFMHRPNFRPVRAAAGALFLAGMIVSLTLVKPWDRTVLASDTAVKPSKAEGLTKEQFFQSFREREILFYKEGTSATVSVAKLKDNISLAVNGKVDASNGDAFTQYLLGHLPMLLHPSPEKAVVIGLGSGSTLAAVAAHPVKELHSVELEPAVVEATAFFTDLNRNVLKDPRVISHVSDGRNFLAVNPQKYDVIISEPSNPWMAGVANLFSLEHFKTMKDRLEPGGIACQWLHAYSMSRADLAMIIRTFTEAFDHVQLWTSYYPDLILLGTKEPIRISLDDLEKRLASDPLIYADLKPHGIRSAESFMGSYWLGDKELRMLGRGADLHTDNLPLLEFTAPRNLYRQTVDENYHFLNSMRNFEYKFVEADPPVEENAPFYFEVARSLAVKKMYRDATVALGVGKQIAPEHPLGFEVTGILNFYLERYEEAKAHFLKAVESGSATPEAAGYLGQIYLKEKDYISAEQYLRRAWEANPEHGEYEKLLADALFGQDKLQEALDIYRRLYNQQPSYELLNMIVEIRLKGSDLEEQLKVLEEMTAAYPQSAPAYAMLGMLLEQNGRPAEALAAYEKYAETAPNRTDALLRMARVYDHMGRKEEMAEKIREAVRLEPSLKQHPEIQKILSR